MLRVNVGKSRKLSRDFNSHGFSVTLDGEITAPLDDGERVLSQIQELFDIADESLRDQVERFQHDKGRSNTHPPTARVDKQTVQRLSRDQFNRPTNANGSSAPATNKQVQYLLSLGRQRGFSKVELESHVAESLELGDPKSVYELSKSEAATAIDQLVKAR